MVDTPVRVFFWKYVAAHSNEYMVQGFSVLWWCSERVKKFIPENVCHSMHSCHMTDDHRSLLLYWYWYVLVLIVDVVFTYLHKTIYLVRGLWSNSSCMYTRTSTQGSIMNVVGGYRWPTIGSCSMMLNDTGLFCHPHHKSRSCLSWPPSAEFGLALP